MRRTFNGHEIVQVTRAQCPACAARSVFSVLVTESGDADNPNGRRAFYTCDRAPLTRRYSYHDCKRETAQRGGSAQDRQHCAASVRAVS
jgi:hypothetical protein